MVTSSGDGVLDVITKHIWRESLNPRIRELSRDFFSKNDFEAEQLKFVRIQEYDKLKSDLSAKVFQSRKELVALNTTTADLKAGFERYGELLEQYCPKDMVMAQLSAKADSTVVTEMQNDIE